MPSYLVSAKEAFVPMELYQAPIEALGETMRVKQQQYDQAFSQISQSIGALENLPVTGEEVKMLKQRYLSDASNKLKNISSVDLSIPQNISEANKIFDPYLNDPVLMQNTEKTIFNANQMKAVEEMQFSKDEKIREGYHPALKQYLMNDRENLEKAGLDPNAYRNFQYRKAIPFINQQKFLEEAAKAEGKTVINTVERGFQLYEIENGKASFENYAAWAKSKLNDPRFNEQYMIIGTVEKENEFKQLRQNPMYANYTDDQLKSIHADKVVTELENGFTTRKNELELRNKAIEIEMAKLTYVAEPTTQLEKNANDQIEAYRTEYKDNQSQISNISSNLTKYEKGEREKTRNFITENPGAYYASLARNADINNFAAGKAAMEQVKVSKNDALFNSIAVEQKWKEIAQKDEELKMRKEGTWDTKGENDGSGNGSSSSGGGTSSGSASAAGISLGSTSVGTDGTRTAADMYLSMMRQQLDIHSAAVWDPTSGMMSVVSTLGLPGEQVVAASTGLMKKARDSKYEMTPDEKAASDAVETALEKATGVKITGPGTFKNALYAYTNKHLEGAGSTRPYTQKDYQLYMAYQNAHKTGQTIEAYTKEEQRVLEGVMAADKKYSKLIVEDGGKKRMVNATDIASVVAPSVMYFDKSSNTWKAPTENIKEQLGENYLNGKGPILYDTVKRGTSSGAAENVVDYSSGHVIINNEKVPVNFVNPQVRASVTAALSERFGAPVQLSGLIKDLKSKVVPNEQHFKSLTGQMTPRIGFVFDERGTVLQEPAVRIIQELTTPESVSDNYAFDVATNKKISMEPEDRANLLNVMKNGEDVMQKYLGPPTYDPYASKNGRVVFTLKSTLTDKEIEAAGLQNWKGKDIVFELNNVSTMGPTLKEIRTGQQFYVWKDLLDGKPISSPDIIRNGLKFGFKIIPTRSDSSATEAYTEFTFPVWDKTTGIYQTQTVSTPPYKIKGDGAVDPDTRLNKSYEELSKRIAAITSQNVTKTGVKGSDLLK